MENLRILFENINATTETAEEVKARLCRAIENARAWAARSNDREEQLHCRHRAETLESVLALVQK